MTPTGTPLPDYGIPDAASREEMSKLEWTSEGEERAERDVEPGIEEEEVLVWCGMSWCGVLGWLV